MTKSLFLLFAIVALFSICTAQTQYLVSPPGYQNFEGPGNNAYPFTTNPFTFQQIHGDLKGRPRTITGIAFRRDCQYPLGSTRQHDLTLSLDLSSTLVTTTTPPSSTFASNHGPDRVQVLTGTRIKWLPVASPANPPAGFFFTIPFPTKPFIYKNTPGLCWELRISQQGPGVTIDCTGSNHPPSAPFGTGCRATGRSNPVTIDYAYPLYSSSANQWSLRIRAKYLPVSTPVAWFIGTSNQNLPGLKLPLDLTPFGMTGCNLYTSIAMITSGLSAVNGYYLTTGARIAFNPALIGARFFNQVFAIDPGRTPVPLVASNGCMSTFDQGVRITRIFTAGNALATNGIIDSSPFGAITRFTWR